MALIIRPFTFSILLIYHVLTCNLPASKTIVHPIWVERLVRRLPLSLVIGRATAFVSSDQKQDLLMALFYPSCTCPQLDDLYRSWHDSLARPLYDLRANRNEPLHTHTHNTLMHTHIQYMWVIIQFGIVYTYVSCNHYLPYKCCL